MNEQTESSELEDHGYFPAETYCYVSMNTFMH